MQDTVGSNAGQLLSAAAGSVPTNRPEDAQRDNRVFDAQFTILRDEIQLLNSSIRQMDEITKSIKEWAIVAWSAAVGLSLKENSLHPFIGLTAVVPLLFMVVDASFRRIQRKFIFRMQLVGAFVRDELADSVRRGEIVGFSLLDPLAARASAEELGRFIGWTRTLGFTTVSGLYFGLITMSLILDWVI